MLPLACRLLESGEVVGTGTVRFAITPAQKGRFLHTPYTSDRS